MSTPDCTVCIANYNGEVLLPECIDSVLQQDCGFDVEVIVHDDASTDGSVDLLKKRYPGVRIIESGNNVGFCISNNRMAAQARGDYLLLLNNDAALYPDALQTLLNQAKSSQEPSILSLPQYDWETNQLIDRGCLLDPFYNPVPKLDSARGEAAYVIGACLFLPRGLWNELGGFPQWMESIAEDMYLCCHARLLGHRVEALAASGYRHRQGASFGGNNAIARGLRSTYRRRYLSERNKTAVMVTCTPTLLVWPLLALHCTLLLLEGSLLSLLKFDARPWRRIYGPALAHTARSFSFLLSERKKVQRERQVALLSYLAVFTIIPRKLAMLFKHGIPSVD